ncbi:MAG: sigma-70 family RNA polymerase sigma factor [Rhodoferax sp.]|nr:sigma-70 family RNA polymerase sigma factor [Rhodoferax sp.]
MPNTIVSTETSQDAQMPLDLCAVMVSDQSILERIASGEREAFAELVQRYQQPLFGFLGRMGMTQAQAEDLAQETFLRAWSHLNKFDPARAQFSTWLHTIARNLAFTLLASRQEHAGLPDDALADIACEHPSPMQQLQAKQERELLQHALRSLPLTDRSALALAYVQGISLTDVARIEGVSLAAIKTRLHRARQALRSTLEKTRRRTAMNDDLDTLLGQDLLRSPTDFTYRVMQGIKPLPMPFEQSQPRYTRQPEHALHKIAVRIGMIGAGLLGLSQVVSFVFGVWLASSAL